MHLSLSSLRIFAFALLFATVALPKNAQAVPLVFEYTFGDNTTVTGLLEGEVQLDGDTVLITGAYSAEYQGQTIDMSSSYIGYFSEVQNTPPLPIPIGTPGEGVLSFSGDTMDFFACDLLRCDTGVIFSTIPSNSPPVTAFTNFDTLTAAIHFEFFQDNWSLSLANTAIPEPSTLWLLLLGVTGVYFSHPARRKMRLNNNQSW